MKSRWLILGLAALVVSAGCLSSAGLSSSAEVAKTETATADGSVSVVGQTGDEITFRVESQESGADLSVLLVTPERQVAGESPVRDGTATVGYDAAVTGEYRLIVQNNETDSQLFERTVVIN